MGKRTTSSVGYSLLFATRDNRIRPTKGHSVTLSQDFAGLGGRVKYVRSRIDADKFWNVDGGFIFSLSGEAGYIHSLEKQRSDSAGNEIDKVRLTARFVLGSPQMRGFELRCYEHRMLLFF